MARRPPPGAPGGRRGAPARRRPLTSRAARLWRRTRRLPLLGRQLPVTTAFLLVAALVAVGMVLAPDWVPTATMLLIVLVAVFVLRFTGMLVLSGAILAATLAISLTGLRDVRPGALVVLALSLVIGLAFVRSRDRLGLQGATSDLMLVDLRDRLVAHGAIPSLPSGWRVDSYLRSAYGEAFSGDFVVASRSRNGMLLEIVLVDVSGKGQAAGVRSLLLSGAFGGLLGAMAPEEFLPAANRYLLRQDWPEGFATAIHVALELETGHVWISTAGHLPPLHLHAGSGLIEPLDTVGGPALGVVADPVFGVHTGRLERGDTLLLYTDGLVENPGNDVDLGIDRLMGQVERVVATRSGGAEAVAAGVRAGEGDDRALILVHREGA